MERRNLEPGKRLYKGNLHTHTTVSDGALSPSDALRWYRDHGYDFVALTDHWRVAEPVSDAGVLVVEGVEFDGEDPELGQYHLVGLDLRESSPKGTFPTLASSAEFILERGSLAVLCHPYWCGMSSWAVERSNGVFAVEVFNSTCEIHIAKGLSSVHWDDALARGRRFWGLAVDDTHWHRPDAGGGWVMVQAESLSAQAIMKALEAGRFYSSSGPYIEDFVVTNKKAYARTSPARRIAFVCDNHHGHCCYGSDCESGSLVEGDYALPDTVTYVRLEVDDKDGKRAWSNPIYLRD